MKTSTTISIGKSLWEQVAQAVHEMGISRSRFFVLTVEEFLQRGKDARLLAAINAAYRENPTIEEEEPQVEAMRRLYASRLKEEKW